MYRSEPINPEAAVEEIWRMSELHGKAKAKRRYLEEFRKSKKSMLMKEHLGEPLGAQEREAYAHKDYQDLLKGLEAAVEEEETLYWRLVAAQEAIGIWRSREASGRAIDRAAA